MPPILPGARVKASYWTEQQESYDDTVIGTVGGMDAWFSGSPGVNTTFIAPETGKMRILVSAAVGNAGVTTGASILIVSFRVHEGSDSTGTQVQAETLFRRSARYQVFTNTNAPVGGSLGGAVISGLTAGTQYWAEWRGRQTGGTGLFTNIRARQIIVEPAT